MTIAIIKIVLIRENVFIVIPYRDFVADSMGVSRASWAFITNLSPKIRARQTGGSA